MNQNGHLFTKRKAIAIYRVSTKSQCDSIEVQTQYVQEYSKTHPELELIKTHPLKESAYCLKPKELDNIIKNAPDGCAIIIMKVDRLTRNHKDIPVFEEKIEQHDIEFHFIEEGIVWNKYSDRDTSNKITEQVVKAEKESISTSDRTKKCNAVMRSKGKITVPAPFGYINYQIGREKGWKPHESESKYVKKLFSMYSTGEYSIEGLVNILNKQYAKKISKPVSPQHAHEILRNPFFIGLARYDGGTFRHGYQTFISKKLFESCQKILKQKRPKNSVPPKLISPLYNMVKHKQSGYILTPYAKKGRIYMKTNKSVKVSLPNEKKIIDGVHNALNSIKNKAEIKDVLHAKINEANIKKVEANSVKIRSAQNDIDRKKDRIAKLLSGELYGGTDEQIKSSVSDLNAQIQNQKENLANYKAQKKQLIQEQVVISEDLVDTFGNLSTENKHTMLETLFSGIVYDDGTLIYNFYPHISKSSVFYRPIV